MKKNIFLLLSVIVIISIFVLNRSNTSPNPQAENNTLSNSQGDNLAEPRRSESKYAKLITEMELTEEELAAKPEDINEDEWRRKVFFHRSNVQMNNGDVEFYGKIVDQNNQPVEGVEVNAYSNQYVESIKEQLGAEAKEVDKNVQAFTDSKGLFSILGYRAKTLRFESVRKPGYSAPPKLPVFSYSPSYPNNHKPEKRSPVIIKIRENLNPEPLLYKKLRKQIVSDGRSYSIDLKTGELVKNKDGGNFTIKVKADYDAVEGPMYYPWGVEIEFPEGGATVTTDPQSYLAPEAGYKSNFSWGFQANEKDWNSGLTKSFYIKGKGGDFYSYMKLNLITFHTNITTIEINIFLNPASSRVLKYDPSQRIK